MPTNPDDTSLAQLCRNLEAFEASGSVANTGTGSRREGEDFEHLVAATWEAFCRDATSKGAATRVIDGPISRSYVELAFGSRRLYVPVSSGCNQREHPSAEMLSWLAVVFQVSDLIASFPGRDRVELHAPTDGAYANGAYHAIYDTLRTKFDATVLLVDGGVLQEKILLEYKTAKSSSRRQIDGNAHERLSFQIMQYLEIAASGRYPRCSLTVIANGAFVRYRNKYHVNFHVQSKRLAAFPYFDMDYACTAREYLKFYDGLLAWLITGEPRKEVPKVD